MGCVHRPDFENRPHRGAPLMLRAVRAFFGSDAAEAPADAVEAAYRQHAEAKAGHARCIAALAESQGHLDRIKRVIDEAAGADAALEVAEAAAASAAQAWAQSDATGEPDSAAFEAAQQARTTAYRARLKSDGAKAALPGVRESHQAAKIALEAAQEKAHLAFVHAFFVENIKPKLAELDELAPHFLQLVSDLQGFRVATNSAFGGFKSPVSAEVARCLEAHGLRAPTAAMSDEAIDRSAAAWQTQLRELVR
jgi:hypothetical protein